MRLRDDKSDDEIHAGFIAPKARNSGGPWAANFSRRPRLDSVAAPLPAVAGQRRTIRLEAARCVLLFFRAATFTNIPPAFRPWAKCLVLRVSVGCGTFLARPGQVQVPCRVAEPGATAELRKGRA